MSASATSFLGRLLEIGPREPEAEGERRRWTIALLILAALAILLRWHATAIGPMSDDYMQYGMVAGLFPGEHYVPFDLYAFLRRGPLMIEHVEKGTAPWWSEPELHGTVLRPLSSLMLTIDHLLLPKNPWAWHVHSQLWFGAAIVSFGFCARRLLGRKVAMLAVLLFALEAGVVSPLGWLANRCVLICATFGFLALRVHLSWRRPDPSTPAWVRRHGPLIEGVLMGLCISGGEYGLAIVVYVFAWELLAGGEDGESWGTRAKATLPVLVPTLAYLVVHKAIGYGTLGADVYADPFHSPLGWAKWALIRMPKLVAGAFWSVPAATIHVFRHPAAIWWHDLTVPPRPTADDYHHM
ncbi:MAG: hypothetical protein KC431_25315, partial [Myxococcales bacterium]|nr:hypothetical protein [Myxococcales bacterium]